MSVSAETVSAYLSGEMSAEEQRRIEAEIAADPQLAAYVAQQKRMQRDLHTAFDAVLEAPLPEALLAAIDARPSLRQRMAAALRSLASRRTLVWSGIPAAAALAAGLVIGVVLAPSGGPLVPANGGLIAQGALADALSHQLAARPQRMATAEIGISFRDKHGQYCRSFTTGSLQGVACHRDGAWQIAALSEQAPEAGSGAEYRPAGSAMAPTIRNAVQGMIAGAPLDAAQEARAQAAGWNPR